MMRDAMERVDRLAEHLSSAKVPSASPALRDAQIRRALAGAAAPPVRAPARGVWWAAALLLFGVSGVAWGIGSWGASPAPRLTELRLETGDRIIVEPGTRIEWTSESRNRLASLTEGEAVFDVQPLGVGESFVVNTPELTATVRGTVFSVARRAGVSSVYVYEGRVAVTMGGETNLLVAGEGVSSGDAISISEALEARAAQAVALRHLASSERGHPSPTAFEPPAHPVVAASEPPSHPVVAPSGTSPSRAPMPRSAPDREAEVVEGAEVLPANGGGPSSEELRRLLAERRFDEVLSLADEASRRTPADVVYARLGGQALEGLGRFEEAATRYAVLAAVLPEASRPEFALRAASLYHRVLHRPMVAARILGETSFLGSPLEERALGLRLRALEESESEEARSAAQQYLERFPEGGLAPLARSVLEP